jgi:multiple sugar transport system substrate-binding protein
MTGKANAKQYVGLGGTAVRKSVMTDPDMVAKNWTLPIQMESLERAGNMVEDGILWLPPHGKFLKIIESLGSYGSQVLSGQMDADDAIKAAQKDAERILAEK